MTQDEADAFCMKLKGDLHETMHKKLTDAGLGLVEATAVATILYCDIMAAMGILDNKDQRVSQRQAIKSVKEQFPHSYSREAAGYAQHKRAGMN